MKSNVLSSVMLVAGALLLYSAIKNQDPRDLVRYALGNRDIKIRQLANVGEVGSTLGKGLAEIAPKLVPNSTTTPPGPTLSV